MSNKTVLTATILMLAALSPGTPALSQQKPTVLLAETVIDGSGKVLHHTSILVEGNVIKSIGAPIPTGAVVYDLGNLTVTPGLIDTHAHILWHFDNGRLAGSGEPPLQAMLHGVDNAIVTLSNGFTTIQSPGMPDDKYLRDAITDIASASNGRQRRPGQTATVGGRAQGAGR